MSGQISIDWAFDGTYWKVDARMDDSETKEILDELEGEGSYRPLPTVEGSAKSRSRDKALAYALEDLAEKILKEMRK